MSQTFHTWCCPTILVRFPDQLRIWARKGKITSENKKLSNLNSWILSTNQITLHCSFIVLILIPNYFVHYTVNLYCVLKMHNFVIFEIRYLAKHNKSALFTHLSKHSINKWALWSSRRSSHFVPHVWLHNISTRPSAGHFPPTSRISKLKNLK